MDQLIVIKKNFKCSFCGFKTNDYVRYGPMYKLGNVRAHYYCVLLSYNLYQNGNDEEGMLGFLLSDIQNELHRSLNIICVYCERGNATIKCSGKKCRKNFHLPCGMRNGSLHQFVRDFKSFCHKHRPSQKIPCKILREVSKSGALCCICYESADVRDKKNVLWAPCCLKTWYHRCCVQKLAHNAGYFFRCAACNDVSKFKNWMQRFGIFIPQRDASWELEPNAFQELLFRYDRCDAQNCKCPEGRRKNAENTMWEIVVCESCGSQGMHIACGNLKFVEPEWECGGCEKVSEKMRNSSGEDGKLIEAEDSSVLSKLFEISQRKRRRGSDDLENSVLDKRRRRRSNIVEEEIEIEIDVETVEESPRKKDIQTEAKEDESSGDFVEVVDVDAKGHGNGEFEEILSSLKPGPLSYKLSVIRAALMQHMSPDAKEEAAVKAPEVISLIDHNESDEVEGGGDNIMPFRVKKENDRLSEDESSDQFGPPERRSCKLRKKKKLGRHCQRQFHRGDPGEVIVISD